MQRTLFTSCLLATTVSLTAQSTTGYLVDSNSDQLFTVDLATGAATLIASTNNNGLGTPADLSWRTATQELWTIDLAGGEVGTIDVTTGTFTVVYQTNLNGWQGMAWDETTQMFYLANQNGSNYVLDPATSTTTLLGAAGFGLITALDTDASGNLFGLDFSTGACVSIDKVTGFATASANTIANFQGLGIDAATSVWYGANTTTQSLYTIDPATGASTVIGPHGAGITFAKGFDLIELGANFASKIRYGQGCYDTDTASFYETFVGPIDLLPGTSLVATNTGTGYVVLPGGSQWYTPASSPVVMGDDQVLQFPLGWQLDYPNGSTMDLWVSSNGFVNLTSTANNGCCAGSNTGLLSGGARWAALWNDLNPSAGGAVYFDTDPVNSMAYVTFDQVPRYGTQDLNTFQYAFDSNGAVELRYGACAAMTGTTLIGWSPGLGNVDPGPIDLSVTPVILTDQTFALTLDGDNRPVIGTTLNMTINRIPAGSPLAALLYGLTKYDPGISLASFGMTGCFQYVSQDSVLLFIAPGTSATNPFTVPNDPGLAGVEVKVQGAAYNPGVIPNVTGASSSNGVQLTLDIN